MSIKFPAIIASDKSIGIQFHPEKSGKNGLELLSNILKHISELNE